MTEVLREDNMFLNINICANSVDVGHVTKSQRVLGECKYQNRDATTSCQQAAEVIQLNTR